MNPTSSAQRPSFAPREPTIRAMVASDVRATARLHHSELPTGLFPSLGPSFLSAFHRSFVDSPWGVAFVPISGASDGFLVGTVDHVEHVRWVLRRRGPRLALRAVLPLVTQPRVLRSFLRTRAVPYLRRLADRGLHLPRAVETVRQQPGRPDHRAGDGRHQAAIAVLWHVAVAPEERGRNIGTRLVHVFVDAATAAGADDLRLVTEHGPRGAGGFYERAGWSRVDIRQRNGRAVAEYRRTVER